MKPSDEALALAKEIDSGERQFISCIEARFWSYFDYWFDEKQHRVISLCLYAAILKDEGK